MSEKPRWHYWGGPQTFDDLLSHLVVELQISVCQAADQSAPDGHVQRLMDCLQTAKRVEDALDARTFLYKNDLL